MKRNLTPDDVRAAIWGGAILGDGGGGPIAAGERAATLALQVGTPQLCERRRVRALGAHRHHGAGRRAGRARSAHVQPAHLLRTLELLRRELPPGRELVGLHANENGAETTVNGWFHAADERPAGDRPGLQRPRPSVERDGRAGPAHRARLPLRCRAMRAARPQR